MMSKLKSKWNVLEYSELKNNTVWGNFNVNFESVDQVTERSLYLAMLLTIYESKLPVDSAPVPAVSFRHQFQQPFSPQESITQDIMESAPASVEFSPNPPVVFPEHM